MDLIDFILNLAGLLVWLNWRSLRFDPLAGATPKTLVGTLKHTRASPPQRWIFLALLASLLLLRALLYWQIGPALDWTAKLDLGARTLYFRSDYFGRILLYSVLSFACALGVLYMCLLLTAAVNRRMSDDEPLLRLVRLHLGRLARWPIWLQLALPWLVTFVVWLLLYPLLARWQILTHTESASRIVLQATVIGVGSYLPLRHFIAALLVLNVLNSYIYLGKHAVWGMVDATARNLLKPLAFLPLRLGRVDFAPLAAIVMVFVAGEIGRHWLPRLCPL